MSLDDSPYRAALIRERGQSYIILERTSEGIEMTMKAVGTKTLKEAFEIFKKSDLTAQYYSINKDGSIGFAVPSLCEAISNP